MGCQAFLNGIKASYSHPIKSYCRQHEVSDSRGFRIGGGLTDLDYGLSIPGSTLAKVTIRCVLGQDTLPVQCLFPPRG